MMKNYTYFCLLCAVTLVEMKSQTLTKRGHVGQNLTFECSAWNVWTNTDSNAKYICYTPCTEDKQIIVKAETGKSKHVKRIQLLNKGSKGLSVTFFNLQKSDQNIYYCGLDRIGKDSFIKVNLEVLDVALSVPKTTSETATTTASSCTSNIVSSDAALVITQHNSTLPLVTEGTGIVSYLTVGAVILVAILMILLIITKKMKKQMPFRSCDDIPEPDSQQTTEYAEVGAHRSESQPEVISVYALVTHPDKNPENVYANVDNHVKKGGFQDKNHPKGRASRYDVSAVTVPQTDSEYSLLQLPR